MQRYVNPLKLLDKSSYFLFGARGVGKSYLIGQTFGQSCVTHLDLLNSETYFRLKAKPSSLEVMAKEDVVVIDEVQRIPELLNEVHRLIEMNKGQRFLLTGSSARKLKRGGANLMAGRAYFASLLPLTWQEISAEGSFGLDKYLVTGALPSAYIDNAGFQYLFSYIDAYMKEEIQAEALVRNLANFARFVEVAAMISGEELNYTKVASDCQLPVNTVRDYFQILEDTLLGYRVHAWKKGNKRKATQREKFFLFDVGVRNALLNVRSVAEKTTEYGKCFEHFIANEIRAFLAYHQLRESLCYWRTSTKLEVDFIVGQELAIDVKSAEQVSQRDHKGLEALSSEGVSFKHRLIVSKDIQPMRFESGVEHMHWEVFLQKIWNGELISKG